jgi:predicted nucleic acid-binding protein
VTRLLLDTTVLIDHLRGDDDATRYLVQALANGDSVATSCVNVAEAQRGIRPKERKALRALLDRLDYLDTRREAAERAGRYQADFSRGGITIHTSDALIAGTARAHGAVVVTDNVGDFPMADVRVLSIP